MTTRRGVNRGRRVVRRTSRDVLANLSRKAPNEVKRVAVIVIQQLGADAKIEVFLIAANTRSAVAEASHGVPVVGRSRILVSASHSKANGLLE